MKPFRPVLLFRIFSGWIALLALLFSSGAEEPVLLSDRKETYFDTAMVVLSEIPETVEEDGREYRVLLQDTETEKVRPKTKKVHASGFFLYHEGEYYFATAQHVARVLSPASRLGFRNSAGGSRQFVLAKLVGAEERFEWRHHEKTDVSLLKLHLPDRGIGEVADLAIHSKDLQQKAPPRTSRLVVAGYPGGLGARGGKISPITAVVHIASEEIPLGASLEGIPVESVYLVNPPAGKGYSGGPIFHTRSDGSIRCIGMLNGAWSDPTGGKFSICVSARYLFDLFDDPSPEKAQAEKGEKALPEEVDSEES